MAYPSDEETLRSIRRRAQVHARAHAERISQPDSRPCPPNIALVVASELPNMTTDDVTAAANIVRDEHGRVKEVSLNLEKVEVNIPHGDGMADPMSGWATREKI